MRRRRVGQQRFGRRLIAPRRHLADDDPLFEEREMEFSGAGEEKAPAPAP
jgi:hypothetical protein